MKKPIVPGFVRNVRDCSQKIPDYSYCDINKHLKLESPSNVKLKRTSARLVNASANSPKTLRKKMRRQKQLLGVKCRKSPSTFWEC